MKPLDPLVDAAGGSGRPAGEAGPWQPLVPPGPCPAVVALFRTGGACRRVWSDPPVGQDSPLTPERSQP